MQPIRRKMLNILMYGQHFAARFLRPMTLGVRAAVLDEQNRVLLVRHSYVPGWHLPGGGVDAGEPLHKAVKRELLEETAVKVTGEIHLHGIFYNDRYSRRDHVAVYVVRDFDASAEKQPDWEIREARFFAIPDLPDSVTAATRARLTEILEGKPPGPYWRAT